MALVPWTYRIDALDVNDWANYVVEELPELDNATIYDLILVPMAGDFPWYVRSQPTEGQFTLNLTAVQPNPFGGNPVACTETQWALRLAALRAVLTPGLHTLTVKARGMTAEKSVQIALRSMATAYKTRGISLSLTAPTPEFV